ncbi:MAG: iron-sulfur cluster assembly protein [Aquificaceae bacterium]
MGHEELLERLRLIVDPHTGMDIVSMGLVKDLKVDKGCARIVIRPTSPFCPVSDYLVKAVEEAVESLGYKPEVSLWRGG